MTRCLRILALLLASGAILSLVAGCGQNGGDKVPITTTSKNALDLYVQGRDLAEKLRLQEARALFEQAIALDPQFALAYLNLAYVQPSPKAFREQLYRAVALADQVTEGERLQIQGARAAADGDVMRQRELFMKLVEAYPDDERAHNLLANSYFGQQQYPQSIAEYRLATRINPEFSQPYNQLGYAYRFLGRYDEAEQAFKKYIDLIPDDPNPYDSYADLLMKIGKFDASIEQYRKALARDSHFVPSHLGVATNLIFKDDYEAARDQVQQLLDGARNDGERRAAYYAMAISFIHEGKPDPAVGAIEKAHALAEAIDDAAAMANDLMSIGDIFYEFDQVDEAAAKYEGAAQVIAGSDFSPELKEFSELGFLYRSATVALKREDLATARGRATEFLKRVVVDESPNQIRRAHRLAGMIALHVGDFNLALAELEQASHQDPYNLYRMALAYRGLGDSEKARGLGSQAALFNAYGMRYAFVRAKALKFLDSL